MATPLEELQQMGREEISPLEELRAMGNVEPKPNPFGALSTIPKKDRKIENIYFSDTGQFLDAPIGSASILQDIHQDDAFDDTSGVFEETVATFKKQAAFIALLANAYGLVNDEDIAGFIADRSKALKNSQDRAPEYFKQFQADFQKAEGFFESAGVIMSNPRALGRIIISQTPNSILPLVAGLTGAVAGSFVAPVAGTLAGLGVGTFAGGAIVEIGAWMDQEMTKKGVDMSDAGQVLEVLQDDAFMASVTREAERKGLSTAAVDSLFAVFGGLLLKKALPGTSTISRIGRPVSQVGVETAGEAGGEAVGQLAATGAVDVKDVILEAFSGLGQSAGQVGISQAILREKKVAPVVEEKKPEVKEDIELTEKEKLVRGAKEAIAETPVETIIKAAQEVEDIVEALPTEAVAKKEAEPETVAKVEEALKKIGPTKETQEATIKGAINNLNDQIDAKNTEIEVVNEQLKIAEDAGSPVKALQNKADKLVNELDVLDETLGNLVTAEGQINSAFLKATEGKITVKGDKLAKLEEQSLKVQERTLSRGITEGKRTAIKNFKETAQNVINLIKNSSLFKDLKPKERINAVNKLIAQNVKKFTTPESFVKNLPKLKSKIVAEFRRLERKQTVEDIKKTLEKVKKAKNIAIDVVRQIEALVNEIDLVKRNKDTQKELQETLDFINESFEQGEQLTEVLSGDVRAATKAKDQIKRAEKTRKKILKKLDTINRKNVSELTNQDLLDLLEEINELADLGKLKLRLSREIEELKQQKRIKEIEADAKKLEKRKLKVVEDPREELATFDNLENAFKRALDFAKTKIIAITPMDVIFDLMSKTGQYKGAMFRIFKRTLDLRHREYHKHRREVGEVITDAIKKLGITEKSYKPIGIWATLQQEGGREKLLAGDITEKSLAAFEAQGLTKNEEALYNIMREELEKLKPLILEIQKRVYNKDFTEVKNYFPWLADFEAMESSLIQNMFGDKNVKILENLVMEKDKKDVEAPFTIERVGGAFPIQLDAVDVFLKHLSNATYFIHMAEEINSLGTLAKTERFGKAVGSLGQSVTTEWIDLLARRGGVKGHRDSWILDGTRRNIGFATLGYKLSSALIQPTALLDGAALIGHYAFKGAVNIVFSPQWRGFVAEHFEEIRARMADDVAFAELMSKPTGLEKVVGIVSKTSGKAIGKVQRGGFWALKTLDGMTASAIAAGAYEKAVREKGGTVDFNNIDLDAVLEAERIVRRSQSSSATKDAPSALSQGKFTGSVSVDKLIFQFQSFALGRWSLISHDMVNNGFRLGRTQEGLNIATWLTAAILSEVAIRRGAEELIGAFTGADDLEDFDDVFIEKLVTETIRVVPFAGQIHSAWNYGSIPIPAVSITQKAFEKLKFTRRTKDGEKKFRQAVRAVILLSGTVGVPGTIQVEQIVRKLHQKNN